jgi:Sec-independent protein translocase protein TatA
MPVDLIVVLVIILVVAFVWRGPKTLPKWGEVLGKGVKEAREGATKAQAEIQQRTAGETPPTGDPDHPADRPA